MVNQCNCPGCKISRSGSEYQPCSNVQPLSQLPVPKKKDPLEKDVEKRFTRKIKTAGGHSWKFASDNTRGVSDRVVIFHGRVIFVELKRVKGKMSPLQIVFQKKVLDNDGEFCCLYGNEGVDKFISYLKNQTCWWEKYINAVFILIKRFTGDIK